ncbi:Plastocyanin precursor [Marinobacter litoralis]|uniref:Plastocyanin n=1 Tax=Marinobacter litoralis TaxID=187981 RepID=A0A3M2RLW2_9GAMM|nr:Plastocyanin precursor [Marinobacter litoralis]
MNCSRRRLLRLSGSLLLLSCVVNEVHGDNDVVITMKGTHRGERVWFEPKGVAIEPGTTVTFINRDPGNSHTVTAYHPEIFDRVRRIPKAAKPFDSGYLLPGQTFSLTLTVPGVYDYYCVPHEMAAMVGRIIVGSPALEDWDDSALGAGGVRGDVSAQFPSVRAIFNAR